MPSGRTTRAILALILLALCGSGFSRAADILTVRTPDGGIEPQLAADSRGRLHLVYFKGDPRRGDLFYSNSADGITFSSPIRINSQPGSAVAIGSVRGASLAIGKNDRVHVAWNGSDLAMPKAPQNKPPMLYTRLNDVGDEFEPQRNLITNHPGIDGGGAVAADRAGRVYVVWHAPLNSKDDHEAGRRVWVARSDDDGRTFAPETCADAPATGACGCCALSALCSDDGTLRVIYRSASEMVHRDIYALTFTPDLKHADARKLADWTIGKCAMSTACMAHSKRGVAAAFESENRILFTTLPDSPDQAAPSALDPAPQGKHPALAVNSRGETLLAWTENTGWNRGGSVAWQLFNSAGRPVTAATGRANTLPTWGKVAAAAKPNGDFVLMW
jgi:hypothetical protein